MRVLIVVVLEASQKVVIPRSALLARSMQNKGGKDFSRREEGRKSKVVVEMNFIVFLLELWSHLHQAGIRMQMWT